jgi:hypothetical protein
MEAQKILGNTGEVMLSGAGVELGATGFKNGKFLPDLQMVLKRQGPSGEDKSRVRFSVSATVHLAEAYCGECTLFREALSHPRQGYCPS